MIPPRGRAVVTRLLPFLAAVFVLMVSAREASAYPWMIRHPYTNCTPCHTDPSGGGLLTAYGRGISEAELRTIYGKPNDESKLGSFLFGIETPPWLVLGGAFRNLVLFPIAPSGQKITFYQMQADMRAQIQVSRFRANGSLGFVHENGLPAAVTQNTENNLVSREHWLGVTFGADDQFLLRAGRMNLPFGIRNIEHTLWVRKATFTDLNSAQQHGLAFSYTGEKLRAELMGIAGNFQLNPDSFRERGYSGYMDYGFGEHLAAGISSKLTHAAKDVTTSVEMTRQAHGLMLRYSPTEPLVLFAEADALINLPSGFGTKVGFASYLQGDYEATKGLHLMLTGEARLDPTQSTSGTTNDKPEFGGWATVWWFLAPHADLRIDGVSRLIEQNGSYVTSATVLAQAHLFL
jgi:hypothetical protein